MMPNRSILVALLACAGETVAQNLFGPATPRLPIGGDPLSYRSTTAILTGHFDGDTTRDVLLVNEGTAPQLLHGRGSWNFEEHAWPAGTAQPLKAAAAGDLDGDGDLDLVAIGANAVAQLLLNDGTGSFSNAAPAQFPFAAAAAACVAIADVDGDNDLDFVVGHTQQQNRLYLNNGSGVFVDGTSGGLPTLGGATVAVRFADVDGDGDADLFAANVGQSELALNDGAGHFNRVTTTHLPAQTLSPASIDFGDIDGDTDVDLVIGVPGGSSGGNRLYRNNGSGQFADVSTSAMPGWAMPVVAFVDADADNDLDLVIAGPQLACELLINAGNGTFAFATAAFPVNVRPSTRTAVAADIDGDGRRDVLVGSDVTYWAPDPTGRNVLFQNTSAGFVDRRPPNDEPWGGMLPERSMHTNSLVLVDHDRDGDLDLVIGNDYQEQDRLYENDGHGVFTDVTATRMPPDAANTVGIAHGDLNADGFEDLVLSTYNGQCRLYLGQAAGGFVDATAARMPPANYLGICVALADLNLDNDLDIVLGNDGNNRILFNSGQGFFFNTNLMPTSPSLQTTSVQVVDYDNNGTNDLLVQRSSSWLDVYLNNGAGVLTSAGGWVGNHAVLAFDLNRDGYLDLFRTYAQAGTMWSEVWQNIAMTPQFPQTAWQTIPSATPSGAETSLAAADLDGDRDLDVIATSIRPCTTCAFGRNRIFVNQGSAFSGQLLDDSFDYSRAVATGDVDGDGDVDILIANKPDATQGGIPRVGQIRLYPNLTRHVLIEGAPRLGTTQTIRTCSRTPWAPGPFLTATFVGFAALPTPVPLPPFGNLGLDPSGVIPFASGVTVSGSSTTPLAIPNTPALSGMSLFLQAMVQGRSETNAPEFRLTNTVGQTLHP